VYRGLPGEKGKTVFIYALGAAFFAERRAIFLRFIRRLARFRFSRQLYCLLIFLELLSYAAEIIAVSALSAREKWNR